MTVADRTRQGGFTLIELQVTILIIGILSAIAIPVFLVQREKGWRAQTQAALRNAATAEEAYITEAGAYTDDVDSLTEDEGLKVAPEVTVSVPLATRGTEYCIEAEHTVLGETWHYWSGRGKPAAGDCP
jgi:type IV pilus assembly protein PilA